MSEQELKSKPSRKVTTLEGTLMVDRKKESGAYYTPPDVVDTLIRWATRNSSDRLLDPSAGDGRFLARHPNSVGVEHDACAAAVAMARAPTSTVHIGDFFEYARHAPEKFDCAAGNPPFIRYQRFNGAVRIRALSLCRSLGANSERLSTITPPTTARCAWDHFFNRFTTSMTCGSFTGRQVCGPKLAAITGIQIPMHLAS